MVGIRDLDDERVAGYVATLAPFLAEVTPAQLEAAARWYEDAREVATEVAGRLGVPVEHGAAIVAAFSPRCPWSRNVTLAIDYASGREVATLGQAKRSADAARVGGIDALAGPKVNAFARAIAGDDEAVVIDVWMTHAAGLDRDAPTIVQYREITEAVRQLARAHGVSPRTMQALIWIVVRGSAE